MFRPCRARVHCSDSDTSRERLCKRHLCTPQHSRKSSKSDCRRRARHTHGSIRLWIQHSSDRQSRASSDTGHWCRFHGRNTSRQDTRAARNSRRRPNLARTHRCLDHRRFRAHCNTLESRNRHLRNQRSTDTRPQCNLLGENTHWGNTPRMSLHCNQRRNGKRLRRCKCRDGCNPGGKYVLRAAHGDSPC